MVLNVIELSYIESEKKWKVEKRKTLSPQQPRSNIYAVITGVYKGFFPEGFSESGAIELVKQFAENDMEECIKKLKQLKCEETKEIKA